MLIADFAVEVKGFPPTITDNNSLFAHFEQFGEVLEVCLARDYNNTLMYNKKQAYLQTKIIVEKKRVLYKKECFY